MVLVFWRTVDSDDLPMEIDEVADWAADVDDQIDEWRLQNYEEIKRD